LSAGEKEVDDEDDAFFPNEVDCDFNADRLRRMEFAVSVVVADDAFKLCEIIVITVVAVVSHSEISWRLRRKKTLSVL
jgi:hypothetical protein